MIFWLSLILLIVSIFIIEKVGFLNIPDWVDFLILGYIVIWICIHICFGINFLFEAAPAGQQAQRIKYEELVKNKNNQYIRPDIISWNEKIKYNQKYQRDFWVGPYIPNVYDQFDVITIEE